MIERFFRILKIITGVCLRPPLLSRDLESSLARAFLYYLRRRPHRGLADGTPGDLYLDSPRRRPHARRRAESPARWSASPSASRSVTSIPPDGCRTSSAGPRSRPATACRRQMLDVCPHGLSVPLFRPACLTTALPTPSSGAQNSNRRSSLHPYPRSTRNAPLQFLAAVGQTLPRSACTRWARFGEFPRWLRHPFLPPQASPGAIQQPASAVVAPPSERVHPQSFLAAPLPLPAAARRSAPRRPRAAALPEQALPRSPLSRFFRSRKSACH
jgi:hypothetical protein